jgi:DNA modification methylase
MDKLEEKILRTMIRYFSSEAKANKWYNTPNDNLAYYRNPKPTPKNYVDNGKGEELLEWIELCIK